MAGETGIIPACAGNTHSGQSCLVSSRDHPRVCGEHAHGYKDDANDLGSSPRVRGTLAGQCAGSA